MRNDTQITDQRAQVRPIAFVLDNGGFLSEPVTLTIRPEDLTRNEPTRVAVHQTLGRDVSGWADDFGLGLPTCNISGHTGWGAANRPDGATAFTDLNNMVVHDYQAAKQDAIDSGIDPRTVKLLFIDMLDDFAWNVKPTNFVLRRSKSRPLLFQYNIALQAISTDVENPIVVEPFFGNESSGLNSLGTTTDKIANAVPSLGDIIAKVTGLTALASAVKSFAEWTTKVFGVALSVISAVKGAWTTVVNTVVGIARDLASVGSSVFKTIAAIRDLPAAIKADLAQISAAFNEVKCIFKNSLRQKKVYEDYSSLYGASNCSSTTGGLPPSLYASQNVFTLLRPSDSTVSMSSAAYSSVSAINQSDPVLAPMPLPEMSRHLGIINGGITV